MFQSKKTLGLVLNSCNGPQNSDLWRGVMQAADELSIRTMTFSRGQYNSGQYHDEAVYHLPQTKRLDGLILSCTLSIFNDNPENEPIIRHRFLNSLSHVPVVSYGAIDAEVPGILVDNQQGTRELVQHLVIHHGYRRIAFVAGPGNYHDKQVRRRAYRAVLAENGLTLDPALVITPEEWRDEYSALDRLFNDRIQPPDAIVASNDQTAIALINALQTRGLQVPSDVAVVGFDDIEHSSIITPPLTTVSLRAFARGRQAVNVLAQMIKGKQFTENIFLPTQLVIRELCGCLTPAIVNAAARLSSDGPVQPLDRWESLALEIESAMSSTGLPESLVRRLVDGIARELDGETVFLAALEDVMRAVIGSRINPLVLHDAVSIIRAALLPCLDQPEQRQRLENLWQQARVMIGERAQRDVAYRNWLMQERDVRLARFGQMLNAQPHPSQMMRLLVQELEYLNIPRCLVVLYTDTQQPDTTARVLLDYENGKAQIDIDCLFRVQDLWPDCRQLSSHVTVEPLLFQDEGFGFVLFEMGPRDGQLYDELARLLSSAIKVTMLVESNQKLYEEAVEVNKDKSRFLSMVSHEIRTPLTLLIGLSEMLLHENSDERSPLPQDYLADLTRIHMSAQQLDGLMRDVMDLARSQVGQLKIAKKPLDLGDVLQAASVVGEVMCRDKGLEWRYDPHGPLPRVLGDQTRLQQVVFNLVGNAIKYTAEGYVRLHVEHGENKVKVLVTDTGLGVPAQEQQTIFNEFQQSSATRGYGGLGLGLAICRHLIDLHGGTIGIRDSAENEGTTFYFTLPTLTELDHDPALETLQNTVLLLTEAPSRVTKLADYLAAQGFSVETVQTSQLDFHTMPDWMSNVFAFPPDAIILDVQRDKAWGWELIASLKQDKNTRSLPVLLCSMDQDGNTVLDLATLTKPLGLDALSHVLERFGLHDAQHKILIVDDDRYIRDMHTAMILRQLPEARILHAANGRQGLEIMQREAVDLVLLDLMMPELDGFAVLETMQSQRELRQVPVIVITAQSLTEEDVARLNQGVASVLSKGVFSTDEILWHITQTLDRLRHVNADTQQLARSATAFIHQHFDQPLQRSDIANHVGVSDGHLTRCFRQELGVTPITYLNRYRVEQAKQLLSGNSSSISEIAAAVGFADSGYFARVFRREAGVSPSEFQDMHEIS